MDEIKQVLSEFTNKGWTVAAIADELGVHRQTLFGWKAGKHRPANLKIALRALQRLTTRKRIPKRKRYAKDLTRP